MTIRTVENPPLSGNSRRSVLPSGATLVEFDNNLDLENCLRRLGHLPHVCCFDSAMRHERQGRYSFLTADPFQWIELPVGSTRPFEKLNQIIGQFQEPTVRGCGPFQGGAAGIFSYDLNRSLETIAPPRSVDFEFPAMAAGLYDFVICWDHVENRLTLLAQGFPESTATERQRNSRRRADEIIDLLTGPTRQTPAACDYEKLRRSTSLTRQFATGHFESLTSSFSRSCYIDVVGRCIDYINAGDVFQVNLSQRLMAPQQVSALDHYVALRKRNPSPFAGFLDLGMAQVLSASPERLLRAAHGTIETRPIKGTRPIASLPTETERVIRELLNSEKDRAENIMIVDLMRNDFSRVCVPESVNVTELCALESYETVHHLVSAVEGRLRHGKTALDALQCCFPGGSITGAPKIRAMEIISELEPTARNAYCGSLGYLGFDGTLDANILIRTMTAQRGWLTFPAGGGIVSQSNPESEYDETWSKADGMLRAIF